MPIHTEQQTSATRDTIRSVFFRIYNVIKSPLLSLSFTKKNKASRLCALAHHYEKQHKLKEALLLYNRALVLQRICFGMDHVIPAQTLHNIGVLLTEMGGQQYISFAMVALKESLLIKQKKLGPGHEYCAVTLHRIHLLIHWNRLFFVDELRMSPASRKLRKQAREVHALCAEWRSRNTNLAIMDRANDNSSYKDKCNNFDDSVDGTEDAPLKMGKSSNWFSRKTESGSSLAVIDSQKSYSIRQNQLSHISLVG